MIGKKKKRNKAREILENNREIFVWQRTDKRSQGYCGATTPEPTKGQLQKLDRKVKKVKKARSKFVKEWAKKNLNLK